MLIGGVRENHTQVGIGIRISDMNPALRKSGSSLQPQPAGYRASCPKLDSQPSRASDEQQGSWSSLQSQEKSELLRKLNTTHKKSLESLV